MTQASEVFFADGTVEREDNLLWKTILTPGRLELTPGPGGKRLEKPLVIVEGHAEDGKEVGLQDLYDAFEDGAMQHVTIPTTHANSVLENTGFIRKVRWGSENGKKVLQAAFEFTEPDVRDMVERGTIADVSCGILRNYRKQRDGKHYAAVLEHVNLTNKPWVDGMGAFTKLSDDVEQHSYFFSEQEDRVDLSVDKADGGIEKHVAAAIAEHEHLMHPAKAVKDACAKRAAKGSNLGPHKPDKGMKGTVNYLSATTPKEQLQLASAKRQGLDLAVMHEASEGAMFDYSAKGAIDVTNEDNTQRVTWENKSSMVLRQQKVEDALDQDFSDCLLVDFTASKVLLQDDDNNYWIAGYSVGQDGDIDFHTREEWQSFTPDTNDK